MSCMKMIMLIVSLAVATIAHAQTPAVDSADIADSLKFIKAKKLYHISEYREKDKRVAPGLGLEEGDFIRAYEFSSPDRFMRFSVAESTIETVWILDLKSYGKLWVSNPTGIEAIGDFGETTELPDIPVKVDYDKDLKLYIYSVRLTAKQPFESPEDAKISSAIIAILQSNIYRLYAFEHENKNSQQTGDCISQILTQLMSKEQREELRHKAF